MEIKMDETKKIYFPMEALLQLEGLSRLDKNTVNEQIDTALKSYLLMRDLPNSLQKVILDLLRNPDKFKLSNDFTEQLELLSKKDKITPNAQVERAVYTYLSIRGLPEKAETEVLDLIAHHVQRKANDGT